MGGNAGEQEATLGEGEGGGRGGGVKVNEEEEPPTPAHASPLLERMASSNASLEALSHDSSRALSISSGDSVRRWCRHSAFKGNLRIFA